MHIKENHDLTQLNTFGISCRAVLFVEIEDELDVQELFASSEFKNNPKLFLGGGSNILLTKDFDGIVILNKLKGIEVLEENADQVLVRSMGGEVWHDLVTFVVSRGYWGIENLALIPGTVGAAPMQNIGAYGVELKDTLVSLEAFAIATGEKKIFQNTECEFGYRESVFKNKLRDQYFITAVILRLSKKPNPQLSYKILSHYISDNHITPENPKHISDAVADIRRSKLPDPAVIGNAGSFFKNVFLKKDEIEHLMKLYPDMPTFEEEGVTKVPAGWLIEKCGPRDGTSWKGYKKGSVGVHERQALVLVNHGGARGEEVKILAEEIIASVFSEFGVTLITEVNII